MPLGFGLVHDAAQTVIEINVFISVSKSVLSYFILVGILTPQDVFGSVREIPDQNYLPDLCWLIYVLLLLGRDIWARLRKGC